MSTDKTIRSSSVPSLNVERLVKMLTDSFCTVLERGLPLRKIPSVMLWGPPGVGKSQAVRQIGDGIAARTGKRVAVTDVRLLLFNPIDLRGIPTANADKTLAVWLRPKIFDMDPSPSVVNILFLDEISAAPQSVQAAAYQITLDRVVGEHRLPDNCIVIAAGNRVTDKSVAFKMPKALANRLLHIEVAIDFDAWKHWAIAREIHPKVVGFLSFRRSALSAFDPATDDLAFPTPRAWEMVSDLLKSVDDRVEVMYPLVAGLVGTGAAIEFRTWEKVCATLPSVEDIFAGKHPPVPTAPDALYALVSSMTAFARAHRDDVSAIAHSIRYALSLPPDFSAVLLKDYLYLEPDYRKKLMRISEFSRWLDKVGGLLNGAV